MSDLQNILVGLSIRSTQSLEAFGVTGNERLQRDHVQEKTGLREANIVD